LVGSLLIVTIETPLAESTTLATEGAPVTAAATTGLGQSTLPEDDDILGADEAEALAQEAPAPRAHNGAMNWERFVLGTDEALERFEREHRAKPLVAPSPPAAKAPRENQGRNDHQDKIESPSVEGTDASTPSRMTAPDEKSVVLVDEAIGSLPMRRMRWFDRHADENQDLLAFGYARHGVVPIVAPAQPTPRAQIHTSVPPRIAFGALVAEWISSGLIAPRKRVRTSPMSKPATTARRRR
jgi:hypothetical protein